MFYRKYRKIILPALFLPLFLIAWELYIRVFHVPNYLLPGPLELADSMVTLFVSGGVMKHIRVTMEEILMGTAIGIVIGLVFGEAPVYRAADHAICHHYPDSPEDFPGSAFHPLDGTRYRIQGGVSYPGCIVSDHDQ